MLSLKHLHLCDYAFLAQGGKLSLVGIFDRMLIKNVPAVINPFHVVAVFGSDVDAKVELEATILNPEDKIVFSGKVRAAIHAGKSFNALLGIAGFKVEKPGTYTIRFTENGNELARLEFPVLIVQQASGPPRKA